MDTFAEIIQAVQDDKTIGDESSLFPLVLVKRAINRAYRKAGALFPWPELQDAKKTSTIIGNEYYDYPQTWRPNSVWKVEIDGYRYGETPDGSPLTYDDYLNWKEDYPDSTDKKWANQWRRYFVWPVPTTNGSNNISVWGITNVETLTDNTDVTIFSYSMPECNEAIVLETVAILKSKAEQEKAGEFRSMEAKQILAVSWGKIATEKGKYEKNMPSFDVPDFFSRSGADSNVNMTGRF